MVMKIAQSKDNDKIGEMETQNKEHDIIKVKSHIYRNKSN